MVAATKMPRPHWKVKSLPKPWWQRLMLGFFDALALFGGAGASGIKNMPRILQPLFYRVRTKQAQAAEVNKTPDARTAAQERAAAAQAAAEARAEAIKKAAADAVAAAAERTRAATESARARTERIRAEGNRIEAERKTAAKRAEAEVARVRAEVEARGAAERAKIQEAARAAAEKASATRAAAQERAAAAQAAKAATERARAVAASAVSRERASAVANAVTLFDRAVLNRAVGSSTTTAVINAATQALRQTAATTSNSATLQAVTFALGVRAVETVASGGQTAATPNLAAGTVGIAAGATATRPEKRQAVMPRSPAFSFRSTGVASAVNISKIIPASIINVSPGSVSRAATTTMINGVVAGAAAATTTAVGGVDSSLVVTAVETASAAAAIAAAAAKSGNSADATIATVGAVAAAAGAGVAAPESAVAAVAATAANAAVDAMASANNESALSGEIVRTDIVYSSSESTPSTPAAPPGMSLSESNPTAAANLANALDSTAAKVALAVAPLGISVVARIAVSSIRQSLAEQGLNPQTGLRATQQDFDEDMAPPESPEEGLGLAEAAPPGPQGESPESGLGLTSGEVGIDGAPGSGAAASAAGVAAGIGAEGNAGPAASGEAGMSGADASAAAAAEGGDAGDGDGGGGSGGSGGDACVIAETPILMADGSSRPIEAVWVGDIVLGYSFPARQIISAEVLEILPHKESEHPELVIIETEETKLFITDEHHIMTANGWMRSDALAIGDTLLTYEGRTTVRRIDKTSSNGRLYTIRTSVDNYFAASILVHTEIPEACFIDAISQREQEGLTAKFIRAQSGQAEGPRTAARNLRHLRQNGEKLGYLSILSLAER